MLVVKPVSVIREVNGGNYDGVDVEEEITAECSFTRGFGMRYSRSLEDYLPPEPDHFEWRDWAIDGRPATPAEVREILADQKLMLKLEDEARNN